MELFRRLLVGILGMIDAIVYKLIPLVYNLLIEIANLRPFSNEMFATFANRIYALLGLFMLFKVSFSLIKYIVNPDEFKDQVKGGKKMVINILVVLVLIVAAPFGFSFLGDIETELLNEHVMEKLILGAGVVDPDAQTNMGETTMMAIFTAFYVPDDPACASSLLAGDGGACGAIMDQEVIEAYIEHYTNNDIGNLLFDEPLGEPIFMAKRVDNEKEYAINYMFIVSTIVGIVTALLFLNFCIDIAIRTVKLGFLQLIAPVPIISYIDPSSSKNGMFSKWIKEVGKTFADLFIRLGAVYFAITLIATLMQDLSFGTSNLIARVFIIVGILIFANQIPKLIGDLLGVKLEGNFSLNPMSKINSSPIAAAAVGGVTGLATGALANAYTMPGRIKDSMKEWKEERDEIDEVTGERRGWKGAITGGNKFRQVDENGNVTYSFKSLAKGTESVFKHVTGAVSKPLSPVAGGVSAMVRGGTTASKGKGSAINAGIQGATTASQRRNARDGGYGFSDKIIDVATDVAGVRKTTGTTKDIEDKIKANQLQISNYKRDENAYQQQLMDISRTNPNAYNQAFEAKVQMDKNGNVIRDKDGNVEVKYTYENYDQYFISEIAKSKENDLEMKRSIDDLINRGEFENTEAGRAAASQEVVRRDMENGIDDLIRRGQFTNDDAGRMAARQQIYINNAPAAGLLSVKDYNTYKNVIDHRDAADRGARELEKQNKKLQGYMDARNGKPKDK